MLNRFLSGFVSVWICLVALLNIVAICWFVFSAPNIWEGWGKVQDIYSPFNIANWIAEVIVLLPALVAFTWLERRQKHQSRGPQ